MLFQLSGEKTPDFSCLFLRCSHQRNHWIVLVQLAATVAFRDCVLRPKVGHVRGAH